MHVFCAGNRLLPRRRFGQQVLRTGARAHHVGAPGRGGGAAAFERFQSIWGGESGERILSRVEELGRSLQAPPVPVESNAPEPSPSSEKTLPRRHERHEGQEGQSRPREEFLGEQHTLEFRCLGLQMGRGLGRCAFEQRHVLMYSHRYARFHTRR